MRSSKTCKYRRHTNLWLDKEFIFHGKQIKHFKRVSYLRFLVINAIISYVLYYFLPDAKIYLDRETLNRRLIIFRNESGLKVLSGTNCTQTTARDDSWRRTRWIDAIQNFSTLFTGYGKLCSFVHTRRKFD